MANAGGRQLGFKSRKVQDGQLRVQKWGDEKINENIFRKFDISNY
jgi:hypothetical protein